MAKNGDAERASEGAAVIAACAVPDFSSRLFLLAFASYVSAPNATPFPAATATDLIQVIMQLARLGPMPMAWNTSRSPFREAIAMSVLASLDWEQHRLAARLPGEYTRYILLPAGHAVFSAPDPGAALRAHVAR